MRKLLLLLAFAPFIAGAQTPNPLVDLSKYHDANRINEMIDNNFTNITDGSYTSPVIKSDSIIVDGRAINTELDTLLAPIHMFMYFGDSTVSKSYSTSWAHLTNATDSLFIQTELDGFTVSGDTITCLYHGHYDLDAKFAHDGDNVETISIRFYNVTQTAGIPVSGASTARGANNFMSTPVTAYGTINAGDEIVLQYKGDANGTAVFKNGVIVIHRLHD